MPKKQKTLHHVHTVHSMAGPLPVELQYIEQRYPDYVPRIHATLAKGHSIEVKTLLMTPDAVLKAVHTISTHSQHNYIITWFPKLLRDKHRPIITDADRANAREHGEDIDAAVDTILSHHLRFKEIVLRPGAGLPVEHPDTELVRELSELLYPITVEYAVFRVTADNAHERTEIAQNIVKALFIIGPVAHILEKFAHGVGKIFAASADDLLGESAEIMALRGSGFSWNVLIRRSRILIPVFALATYGAFSVEGLLENGHTIWGGIVFGLSAVALSLTTAIQSFFLYKKNLRTLILEGKVADCDAQTQRRLAFAQDFTNPARLGLFLGAACAPIMGVIGSVLGLMHNGWVLAGIGSTESIVAGLTVILASRISDWRFYKLLRRMSHASHL